MAQSSRPDSIAGGCLCGAIRFTVSFPNESDWPPDSNGICQCTMCRKHSGSVLPQNVAFPVTNVSPPLTSNASYKTYASSPTTQRGFCSTCGSALTFQYISDDGMVEISLGTFDEDVLCGKRDEAGAWEDEHGRHVPRTGGWGKELAFPQYHIYSENEIPGVTDGFEGIKYLTGKASGESFKGKARDLKKR